MKIKLFENKVENKFGFGSWTQTQTQTKSSGLSNVNLSLFGKKAEIENFNFLIKQIFSELYNELYKIIYDFKTKLMFNSDDFALTWM